MKQLFAKIKNNLYTILIIVTLIGCLGISIDRCTTEHSRYNNNIKALNDTIHYYKDKNNNLVATKLAFEANIEELKALNENLYNEIKNLKAKGKVTSATYFTGVIENPQQDTTFIVSHDTIYKGFSHDFAFNNKYRILEGNVKYKDDVVGVNITNDKIMFDYTIALDDKNNIYIKSTNPYVTYNEITGFQLPKQKRKRWSFGPAISVGYDFVNNKPSMSLGASLNYGLIQW